MVWPDSQLAASAMLKHIDATRMGSAISPEPIMPMGKITGASSPNERRALRDRCESS